MMAPYSVRTGCLFVQHAPVDEVRDVGQRSERGERERLVNEERHRVHAVGCRRGLRGLDLGGGE